jgi:hypothetical protein
MATASVLKIHLSDTQEVTIQAPAHLDSALFEAGFQQGMQSNQLTNFKASFRAGFRAAKLRLREMAKAEGVIPFPSRTKFVARF